jgi:hypothetical protein
MVFFSSVGSHQWFVGPASSFFLLEMNVRSSTRATSLGSDRKRKLFGRFFSGMAEPVATKRLHSLLYSAGDLRGGEWERWGEGVGNTGRVGEGVVNR